MPYIRLPKSGRPFYTVIAGAMFGAALAGAGPQLTSAMDRPACAETVMKAVSSDSTIKGAYACFEKPLQISLLSLGIDSDRAFADRIGQNGDYHFLRKTADGGYVYEFDRPTTPHDQLQGVVSALGLQETRADLRRGHFLAAWHEPHNLRLAWAELTGETQNAESRLFTLYLGSDGRIVAVR